MTMHHIATATRTTAGGFDFTNIPQTFTHLRIHAKLRTSTGGAGANEAAYFNADGSTIYRVHYMGGDGGTAFTGDFGANQGGTWLGWVANTAATAGLFSTHVMDVVDYTGSTFKTSRVLNGFDANNSTTNLVGIWSSVYKSTAAINRFTTYGTFAAGSTISIYGISTPTATGA